MYPILPELLSVSGNARRDFDPRNFDCTYSNHYFNADGRFHRESQARRGHLSELIHFMLAYPDIPIACTLLYLALVLYVPLQTSRPFSLKPAVIGWNLFLTVFSMAGSYVCVPHLLSIVQEKGLFASLCGASKEN